MFNWTIRVIEETGYIGIAFLMFLENVFPPIPSELIMPLSGFLTAQGKLSFPLVLIAATAGSVGGAAFWYWIGLKLGRERIDRFAAKHGRWITLCPPDIERAAAWFDRHGTAAVLLGRLVPGLRSMISVPAGVQRMHFGRFLLLSSIGTGIWTLILITAGYLLESQYERVGAYVNPASNFIFAGLVAWYIYRVATFGRGRVESTGSNRSR